MAFGIISQGVTASTAYDYATAVIGGLPASPTYPRTPAYVYGPSAPTPTSAMGHNFVPDRAARYFYYIDGSGNLQRFDASNPTTPPVELLTASALGCTIMSMDISLDNSFIVATTTTNKVIKILTASPYTVTVIAGSGTAASTDGTGAGAAFNAPFGIAIDPNFGLFAFVMEQTSGSLRKVVISSGVVTTAGAGLGNQEWPISPSKDGTVYAVGVQSVANLSAYVYAPGNAVAGSYLDMVAADDDEPGSSFVYFFAQTVVGYTSLCRVATGAGLDTPTEGIAILGTAVSTYGGGATNGARMFFRHPALYLVDTAGNLVQIQG